MSDTVVERSPITGETVEQYAGKWIAIRDGEVVESADTLEELREIEGVRREDAVYLVPERSSYFY
jgi:hypothetical protein